MSKKASRVINGTHAAAWINGQILADLDELEMKVVLDYEDVTFPEDLATHKKLIGWAGDGSITFKKIFSRGALLLSESLKKGQTPVIEITTRLSDPDSYGVERTSVSGVTFNEFLLAKIAQRTLLTEEMSFNFSNFDLLETIMVQENIVA